MTSHETMKRKPLIYVAGPYTLGTPTANTKKAIEAADRILTMGAVPFVPHLSLLWDTVSPKSYETWMDIDFQVIMRCDALLRIPGDSPGADREVLFATKERIPVFLSEESLQRWINRVSEYDDGN